MKVVLVFLSVGVLSCTDAGKGEAWTGLDDSSRDDVELDFSDGSNEVRRDPSLSGEPTPEGRQLPPGINPRKLRVPDEMRGFVPPDVPPGRRIPRRGLPGSGQS